MFGPYTLPITREGEQTMRKKHFFWTLAFVLLLSGGCAWQQGLGEGDRVFTYANISNNNGQAQPTQETGMLTIEEAKAKALVDAGLIGVQVTFTKSELDYDNGRQVYEIEFYTQSYEYDYEIDAATGEIIDFSCDKKTGNITSAPADNGAAQHVNAGTDALLTPAASDGSKTAGVTMQQAKALVFKWIPDATEKDIWKVKTDYKNGRTKYEIKVLFGNAEYEFKIDASTGKVIECKYDAAYTAVPAAGSSTITIEKAKSLALAKIPGATENNILKFKTDYDDGRTEYEIEIVFGNAKYEFELDAFTGKIMSLDYDAEYIVPSVTPAVSADAAAATLTAEEAKALVLARVPGATVQDILEFETDYDDGRTEYGGKLLYGGIEYEFGLDCLGAFHCWKTENVGYYGHHSSSHHGSWHDVGCHIITAASAKSLALAQVPGAAAWNIVEFKTDYDDGLIEYEGKIIYNGMKYEFEIDGYSGAFRKWKAEPAG